MPTDDLDNRPQGNIDPFAHERQRLADLGPTPPTPPVQDSEPEPADEIDSLFPSLDTEHLRRLRAQLRANIPGDATFAAAVATLLGALVDFELATRPPVIPTRSLDDDPVHTADGLDELDVLAK